MYFMPSLHNSVHHLNQPSQNSPDTPLSELCKKFYRLCSSLSCRYYRHDWADHGQSTLNLWRSLAYGKWGSLKVAKNRNFYNMSYCKCHCEFSDFWLTTRKFSFTAALYWALLLIDVLILRGVCGCMRWLCLFTCWWSEKPIAKMGKEWVQLCEITGPFAHLLSYRCHECKDKLAVWGQGERRTDGSRTLWKGWRICACREVLICVCVCVRVCTHSGSCTSAWNQASVYTEMLSWSSAKITSSCLMPALFSFF